ncbi:MAG TPA: DinB family protein [Methylomirabilota bacterium]|jgi:hypothetical protein|nr:DinB family protein [Methylomirabilota bacterium]
MPRSEFDRIMNRWAALEEDILARPWSWRGKDLTAREALYRTLEGEQEALVATRLSARPSEPRLILSLAQRAFGDLRGLLVGLPGGMLDAAPAAGHWAVRQTLAHMLAVERRYAVSTLHAARRSDADPLRPPQADLDAASRVDDTGTVEDVLGRLGLARRESDRLLGALPVDALTRPTDWAGYEVDVRFRLHRFAAHLVEHTVQCEKALRALGRVEAEGRRIVRRIWATRGEHEALVAEGALPALDAQVVERAASL